MALNYTLPNQSNNTNSWLTPNDNFGQDMHTPYVNGMSQMMPAPMPGNVTEDDLYPLQSSLQTAQLNAPVGNPITQNFANGGKVKKAKKRKEEAPNLFPTLAEMIRQQGGEEDTILAHINPTEASMLSTLAAGGGRVNPVTGLPQFGFFDKPGKWLKGTLGGGAGAILGNMVLPGIGGVIGGALGGAAGSAMRGRKDYGQAALRGGAMGAMLPTASSLIGMGANSLGYGNVGNTLSNYGEQNGILKSLGMENPMGSFMGGSSGVSAGSGGNGNNAGGMSQLMGGGGGGGGGNGGSKSYIDQWLKPKNLLTALPVVGSFLNKPKKETAEKQGRDQALKQKAYDNAMQLSPQERAMREADMLAEKQMLRRLERNQYLPEERFAIKPTYRKVNSPAEYDRNKRWVEYYDNPNFAGNPLMMKKGGLVPQMNFEEEEIDYPSGEGFYFKGHTGGQDDKIPAQLSDGEYVIPADVVAHAGDGNNSAGAKHFDKLIKNIRKSKGGKPKLPPKIKPLFSYMG